MAEHAEVVTRALVVAYGGGHINMLVPVIQRLRHDRRYELHIMALTTAARVLQPLGIPWFGFRDLVTDDDRQAVEIGHALERQLPAGSNLQPGESAAYLGLSFADLADRVGWKEAERLYQSEGRAAFLPLGILERAFDRIKPDVLITTNSPRAEKAAILTARRRGVPAVCVNDLFDRREFDDRTGHRGYADRVCVFSESVRRMLLAYGRPANEIIVTGNPAFDELADPGCASQGQALRRQRGWEGKKLILWARQTGPEHQAYFREVERALVEAAARHPDWHIIVRPHPNEQVRYEQLPAQTSLSTQADALPALLNAVDVVATVTSTVGLQAVALGKPLIALQGPPVASVVQYTPYAEMGLAIGVSQLPQLEAAILQALDGPRSAGKVPPPGKATDMVLNVIHEICERGPG